MHEREAHSSFILKVPLEDHLEYESYGILL